MLMKEDVKQLFLVQKIREAAEKHFNILKNDAIEVNQLMIVSIVSFF